MGTEEIMSGQCFGNTLKYKVEQVNQKYKRLR